MPGSSGSIHAGSWARRRATAPSLFRMPASVKSAFPHLARAVRLAGGVLLDPLGAGLRTGSGGVGGATVCHGQCPVLRPALVTQPHPIRDPKKRPPGTRGELTSYASQALTHRGLQRSSSSGLGHTTSSAISTKTRTHLQQLLQERVRLCSNAPKQHSRVRVPHLNRRHDTCLPRSVWWYRGYRVCEQGGGGDPGPERFSSPWGVGGTPGCGPMAEDPVPSVSAQGNSAGWRHFVRVRCIQINSWRLETLNTGLGRQGITLAG